VSRLPIRLRLTLVFAVSMALVLAATGVVLYIRLADGLEHAIDEGLEARAAEVAALVQQDRKGPWVDPNPEDANERFIQVVEANGVLRDGTYGVDKHSLVNTDALARAAERRTDGITLVRDDLSRIDGPVRVFVRPVDPDDPDRFVVVGASLEPRDEAINRLLGQLLVIGPAALLVASLLGYALATAALRPVDSMRQEAAEISAAEPGRRLPLPQSEDEVRRLGETLNAMLTRLERAFARERSFVADASHELRTPLALLKAELDLALRHPRSAEELQEALASAAVETDRLVRLAEDLLVLTRADQGSLPLRREVLSAGEVLAELAERFRPEAERDGRAIDVAAPAELNVVADRIRLEQALGNLIDNALRYGKGPVALRALARNGAVELHVADEGEGFPPDFLPRAFVRFARADEARSGGGSGLGLAIVEAIATAHGGSVHAANSNSGTDVWVSLPNG
jgi:two-component system, OmpR family, sensor kinase